MEEGDTGQGEKGLVRGGNTGSHTGSGVGRNRHTPTTREGKDTDGQDGRREMGRSQKEIRGRSLGTRERPEGKNR